MRINCIHLGALAVVCAMWAVSSLAQKAPASSIEQLQAAVQHSPFDSKVRLQLGLAYIAMDDFPHALEALHDAVRLGPNSSEAHNWLGVALMEKSDLPNAVAEFRKAVALDPKNARAYTNLGSALSHSGETDQAITAFQKALALAPNRSGAQLDLALALRDKGDLEGALRRLPFPRRGPVCCQRSIRTRPNIAPKRRFCWGSCRIRKGGRD